MFYKLTKKNIPLRTLFKVEDPEYQVNLQQVCVLWNRVPEQLTLKKGMQVMSFKFVMTVDGVLSVAKQEMMDGEWW